MRLFLTGFLFIASTAWSVSSAVAGQPPLCGRQGDFAGEPATIVGSPGDDVIEGTPEPDVISGLGGDDVIKGLGGYDRICGGRGADRLVNDTADVAHGGPGPDLIKGGSSQWGNAGDDLMRGHATFRGGAGDDRIVGDGIGGSVDYLWSPRRVRIDLEQQTATGWGHDTIIRIDHVGGSRFKDVLRGNDDSNVLHEQRSAESGGVVHGRGGNDSLYATESHGGRGADTLGSVGSFFGGRGHDEFDAYFQWSLRVDLAQGTISSPIFANDRTFEVRSVEDVSTGPGNDLIIGNARDNTLVGEDGNDLIRGGGGADVLELASEAGGRDRLRGGKGNDVLTGGRGDDNLRGGAGDDEIQGDDDTFGRIGDDLLDGGSGIDYLDGWGGTDTCVNGETLVNCEQT